MDKKQRKEEKKKQKMEKFLSKNTQKLSISKTKTFSTGGYNPAEVESKWLKIWEESGYFKPRESNEKFVITMPPPNVTGSLHIGHSMMIAIQDCLIRYNRMRGCETLYLPGTDHAGIATQSVVLKQMAKENKKADRENFLKSAWAWKDKYGGRIIDQFKRLGASADFSKEKFTMDKDMSKAVIEAFVRLYEKGLIYREAKIVNWCGKLQTTLSDLEVNHENIKPNTFLKVDDGSYEFGVIYQIKYPLSNKEFVEIQTTRPETILGDTALCANPKDERYTHLKDGVMAINPLTGDKIPIIFDDHTNMEFGTGLLKITPAHDPVDFEIGKRHKLRTIQIFDSENKISKDGLLYGLKRFEARKSAIEILEERELFVKKIPYEQTIPICSRSGDVIEPAIKEQWWCNCQEMAEKALKVVKQKEIEIYPPEAEKIWSRWLENIRDWCLSRQLWWGHRIPAYKSPSGKWCIGRTKKEAIENYHRKESDSFREEDFVQDEDVLDTWFSSGLWPFATMGWPDDTHEMDKYFPGSVLETGSDILFFWVARMVMMSLELTGSIPFKRILLHGIVRDAHGRKMSKSLGNVIDPLFVIDGSTTENLITVMKSGNLALSEMKLAETTLKKDFPNGIAQCGADALRFALLSYTLGMKDINLDISRVEGYRRLCNKIWNANKFCKGLIGESVEVLTEKEITAISNKSPVINWILKGRNETIRNTVLNLGKYNFMIATQIIHQFFLYDFCDVLIEIVKSVKDSDHKKVLLTVFLDILKIFHPYLPFITEEIYHEYTGETIMYSKYPEEIPLFESTNDFNSTLNLVKVLRSKNAKIINIKKGTLDENSLKYLQSLIKKTEIYLFDFPGEYLSREANDNSTVVADIGTETYKIGYSDNGVPSRFGSSCTLKNNFLSPIQNSTIKDLPNYLNLLKENIPEDTTYLCVVENTFEPPETKRNILQYVMEENICSSVLFARSGVLDSFSYGKHSSLVISIGGGSTQLCAVVEGIIVFQKKIDINCFDITKRFVIDFKVDSSPYEKFMSLEKGRMLKEELYDQYKGYRATQYTKDDKHVLEQKFRSTHNDLLQIIEHIQEAVDSVKDDLKALLLSNIVIAGAGSSIPFIGLELENRINDYFIQFKTRVFVRESRFHTFFGGVVYNNIGSTKLFHIGKADYQEEGISILERKNYVWNN